METFLSPILEETVAKPFAGAMRCAARAADAAVLFEMLSIGKDEQGAFRDPQIYVNRHVNPNQSLSSAL